mgnify:CR=1 FL=1
MLKIQKKVKRYKKYKKIHEKLENTCKKHIYCVIIILVEKTHKANLRRVLYITVKFPKMMILYGRLKLRGGI